MAMAGTHARQSAWILRLLCLWASAVLVFADEHSLCLTQNATLQLSRGLPVGNSPGSKPGATVIVERVHIHGLSRFRNLGKFAHSIKVKVLPLPTNSNVRLPNIEVCFHRNVSLVAGMCRHGQWEKVTKGSWARSMSLFDHKILDVRTAGSTLENFEVSVEEAGAWLGFWVVHKLVLTEDGSVDISTAQFVAWAVRILAAVMILQSSMDPLLGTLALLCGSFVSLLKKMHRLRFLRHLRRRLFKSPKKNRRRSQVPDSSPFDDSRDELMYKMQSKEDSPLFRPQLRGPTLSPCKSPVTGFTRTPPKSQEALYPSIIHNTPERKRYSAAEWDAFTKKSTETALEELVASPDFGKWLSTNADRISVTPNSRTDQQRGWMLWS
ncbi:hypothetical protein JHK85_030705 [Glycine max]|nr:hypothetical protein JHK85_030705 [Glycine max]